MAENKDFMLLRYSTLYVPDCIQKHKSILEEKGYCWFGKVGTVPSITLLQRMISAKEPTLVLYKKGAAYICRVEKYSFTRPSDGIPNYYNDEGIFPNVFFKLLSIEQCEQSFLENSNLVTSGANLFAVLSHSRASYMLCSYQEP